jgi:hypothetical protein
MIQGSLLSTPHKKPLSEHLAVFLVCAQAINAGLCAKTLRLGFQTTAHSPQRTSPQMPRPISM